jgi:gamma-glutamyltranspeptidase/glutathione hydrolase
MPNATRLAGALFVILVLPWEVSVRAASHPPVTTTGGVVAADNPIASRVGADILAQGGNAADAAVATALALGVVSQTSSGIGGGGFAIIYTKKTGKVTVLDFREVGPEKISIDKFKKNGQKIDPMLARTGGLAVAVPGEVKGLETISKRFGRLGFAKAIAPAQRLAENGFPVSYHFAQAAEKVVAALPEGDLFRDWLSPGGKPVALNKFVKRSSLAKTLEELMDKGADAFYRGWIAKDMVDTVKAAGGVLTLRDLENYKVKELSPLEGDFEGYHIVTMPLPSSGGIVLLEMLGILDQGKFNLEEMGSSSSAMFHLLAEVEKHGFADRARFLGAARPDDLMKQLLDPARLKKLAERISLTKVKPIASYGDQTLPSQGMYGAGPGGTGTTHLCVIDSAGNAVAMTTTVNGYFGAKVITKKSGIVMNNHIDDFTLEANVPNQFGLIQSEYNLVAPGKTPLSSMTPALIFKDGKLVACVGGSGGPRIISNVFQVILQLLVFGKNAEAALAAPRMHHQWQPDRLLVESDTVQDVINGLKTRGQKVEVTDDITAVQLIRVRSDGQLEAGSDPRKGGRPRASRLNSSW